MFRISVRHPLRYPGELRASLSVTSGPTIDVDPSNRLLTLDAFANGDYVRVAALVQLQNRLRENTKDSNAVK